jgi:hypothetical protein
MTSVAISWIHVNNPWKVSGAEGAEAGAPPTKTIFIHSNMHLRIYVYIYIYCIISYPISRNVHTDIIERIHTSLSSTYLHWRGAETCSSPVWSPPARGAREGRHAYAGQTRRCWRGGGRRRT